MGQPATGGTREQGKAVRHPQTGSVGSLQTCEGQPGSGRSRRAQSIAAFEADLSSNLYKLWNRLSSGSYFPPPVRRVEIPKANGGTRPLGIPTVADRIAQEVARRFLEPSLEPVFHADSYGYRPGRSAIDAVRTMSGVILTASIGSYCSRRSDTIRIVHGCCCR